MNLKETRWRQRYDNFEKAYALLEKYAAVESEDELERAGVIQFFEMAFELAWKLMKDYLEAQGYQIKSPKEAIKQALQSSLVEDGQIWLDALEDRNLSVHTYDESTALEIEKRIRETYFPALRRLYQSMKEKSRDEIRPEQT
jgi:nucleotidyltransferase substrate binding protein (TIGR01987 family)